MSKCLKKLNVTAVSIVYANPLNAQKYKCLSQPIVIHAIDGCFCNTIVESNDLEIRLLNYLTYLV